MKSHWPLLHGEMISLPSQELKAPHPRVTFITSSCRALMVRQGDVWLACDLLDRRRALTGSPPPKKSATSNTMLDGRIARARPHLATSTTTVVGAISLADLRASHCEAFDWLAVLFSAE